MTQAQLDQLTGDTGCAGYADAAAAHAAHAAVPAGIGNKAARDAAAKDLISKINVCRSQNGLKRLGR